MCRAMRGRSLLLAATMGLTAAAACAAASPPPPSAPLPPPPAVEAGAIDAAPEASPPATATEDAGADASAQDSSSAPSEPVSACNEQSPHDFLVRGNFLKVPGGNDHAIQYRTDTYGFFPGFGRPAAGSRPASSFAIDTTFMGLPVRMHKKVVPALACVEQEIKRACADHPYTAHALAGIRFKNTYRGGEVTNHAFGIAIDVDPSLNTCCGCVKPWNDAPRCHRPAKTEYDRMEMPECWVHAFERYGFYWLGHDVLQDTMHYEFLGDPDKIIRSPVGTGMNDGG
jgi:hypothetical protein